MSTNRDLRATPLYHEIAAFYAALHAPGTDAMTDAADLSVSTDGRHASFTGTVYPGAGTPPVTRIGTVDLATGRLEPRAPGGHTERLPRWSPDGATLAYLSDAASRGDPQVVLAHGRDPVRTAAAIDGVIESLQWSPEGTRLLAGVAGRGADLAGCQGGATTTRAADTMPAWMPHVDGGDAENLWRHAWVIDVASGRAMRVGPQRLNVWETCWLGRDRIAVVASDSHSEGSWYTSRLLAYDLGGGEPRELYRSDDQIGVPAAAPSGNRLAVIEAVCSDRLIVAGTLVLIDAATGGTRRIDAHGADVTSVAWRDEATLVYAGLRGLATVAGEVSAATGRAIEWWAAEQRTCGAWYPSAVPLPRGGALVVGESYATPPEIARVDPSGYHVVCSLATAASRAPDHAAARAESIAWTGRDGLAIQGVLIRPAGPGPWPLVMDIHGGPVWACRNRWQGRLRGAKVLADHGIASLYPNPRGSGGRGADFARLVKGDMGGEDTHDYLRGMDAVVERGIADPARLGVTGISYGGFMSAWLVTQDQRFAASVPISTVADWYSQHRTSQIPYFDALFLDGAPAAADGLYFRRSPALQAGRVRTPVLQLTGALDQNTPPTQALEFHRSLLEHGAKSVLATYPTAGHGIRSYPEVIDATTRYVGWFLEHFAAAGKAPGGSGG